MSNVFPTFTRTQFATLMERLSERRRFVQVLAGPRQVGKTTLAQQVLASLDLPTHFASADAPTLEDTAWLVGQWEIGRLRARDGRRRGGVLVLDEVQKIPGWSAIVKGLWDEDSAARLPLRVLILGSSPLLLQAGLTESLAGRFEVVRLSHWSYTEMREAFGWSLDRFLFFGGYPGAASLVRDRLRWARYIMDSLIETTVSRDILLLTRVDKPALLRQLFALAVEYSGQILSYTKMLGQLQGAGNVVTLAHYLELLHGAGMVTGLQKFSGSRVRQRGSSPKLVAMNTALMTAFWDVSLEEARNEGGRWGRLVETAVGAHLVNSCAGTRTEIFYWRDRGAEVDYVLRTGSKIVGVEVTSGQKKDVSGMSSFQKQFRGAKVILIGGQGLPLEETLARDPRDWAS